MRDVAILFIYNYFGELTLQTEAKSQTQSMTYDGLVLMVTRVDKESNGAIGGSSSWTYDTAAQFAELVLPKYSTRLIVLRFSRYPS